MTEPTCTNSDCVFKTICLRYDESADNAVKFEPKVVLEEIECDMYLPTQMFNLYELAI